VLQALSAAASTLVRQLPAGDEWKVEWLLKTHVFRRNLYDVPADGSGSGSACGSSTDAATATAGGREGGASEGVGGGSNGSDGSGSSSPKEFPFAAHNAYIDAFLQKGPLNPKYVASSKSRSDPRRRQRQGRPPTAQPAAMAAAAEPDSMLLPERTKTPARLFLPPDWVCVTPLLCRTCFARTPTPHARRTCVACMLHLRRTVTTLSPHACRISATPVHTSHVHSLKMCCRFPESPALESKMKHG
jgi:hypothetical protein